MSEITFTRAAGKTDRIIAQGHLLGPDESFAADLSRVHPVTLKMVDDGELTASPTLDPFVIEAGKSILFEDPRFEDPVESFKGATIGKTSPLLKHAMHEGERASQVVFEGDDGPQAFATGVTVTLVMRDGDGNDILSNSAFEVNVNLTAGGSNPATSPVIAVSTINQVAGDTGRVRLRSGKATFVITAADDGTVQLGMQEASRTGITITDTTEIDLT